MRNFMLKAVIVSLVPAGIGIMNKVSGNEQAAVIWLAVATGWILINMAASRWLIPRLVQEES
ncbi:MAG: hypothetical protein P8J32_07810 [bacterium]|jgi:putative effector of murein hydrolase LrgA (UPF0299 family)|nr:hypothetical protein [bacterium]